MRKVRGARDQSEILIRLADAIAGFIRDYLEGDKTTKDLYKKAIAKSIILLV